MVPTVLKRSALILFSLVALLAGAAVEVRAQSTLEVSTPTAIPAQPINFSTRLRVQTGDNVGIGGIILSGSGPKHVLIRAIGPSLKQSGVAGALADPTLELRSSSGNLLMANDNWKEDPAQRAFIEADGLPPKNDLESAIDWTFFGSDSFTATVRGKDNTTGLALIEVYDLNPSADSKLANFSTRAFVDTGDNIVIAGFVLASNSGDDRIVVRGIGPSLPLGNALADPNLELRNSNGTLLIANDDWQDNPTQAAELRDVGFAPTDTRESGIIGALPPASYTALLTGANNGTGVGLLEVYDLGAPPSPPVGAAVTRIQAGKSGTIEKQHVAFSSSPLTGTFRISVYKPTGINHSDIGARAALHGQTDPIPFTASAEDIVAAIEAVPNSYYAYGQFGNLELDRGSFSYFASQGAINREPIVTLDPGGTAAAGFTIEFGSLVGDPPRYNTWVAGMPLITISVP